MVVPHQRSHLYTVLGDLINHFPNLSLKDLRLDKPAIHPTHPLFKSPCGKLCLTVFTAAAIATLSPCLSSLEMGYDELEIVNFSEHADSGFRPSFLHMERLLPVWSLASGLCQATILCTLRLYCEDYLKRCFGSPGCLHSSMYRGLLRTTTRTRVHHLFIRTNTGRTHPNRIDRLHEHTKDHVRATLHGRLGMKPQTPAVGPNFVLGMSTLSDSETTLRVGMIPQRYPWIQDTIRH